MSASVKLRAAYVAVSALVLALDQWSKHWVATRLRQGPDLDIIPGLLRLIYAENPGIAFSFFNSGASATRWVLASFSTCAALGVFVFSLRTSPRLARLQLTFALLLAGIVGNLIDRVTLGRVVDFIDAYVGVHHWPTFNIADSAISVGAVLLAFELFRRDATERAPDTAGSA